MDSQPQPSSGSAFSDLDLRKLARFVADELIAAGFQGAGINAQTTARSSGSPSGTKEEALPVDAQAAVAARSAAKARGFFWVHEFAAVIGRHDQFVSDRCAAKVIKTLKGGKPYRIPLSEDDAWNKLAA